MQSEGTLLLRRSDVEGLLSLRDCIDAVEEIFRLQGDGKVPASGILGVKAPNGNTLCGKEATAFTEELVSSGVELYEEPGLVIDARMRRMYNIMTLDGRSVAEELVTAGLARADGQGANHDRLAELEVAAREQKRGCLWSSGG